MTAISIQVTNINWCLAIPFGPARPGVIGSDGGGGGKDKPIYGVMVTRIGNLHACG